MLITKARPAAPLILSEAAQIIPDAGSPGKPCLLTISGSSGLELNLLNITATGFVTPLQEGALTLMLYGQANFANAPAPDLNIAKWILMAQTPPETIGRPVDPQTTQWMIQGTRLMFYFGSGKMQGETLSNIADQPLAAVKLNNPLLGLKSNIDPIAYFAIGALFTPSVEPLTPGQSCTMKNLILNDGT